MILIIDGQGGGIGARLTAALKADLPNEELLAVGANTQATAAMLRAGATAGATGENPVIFNAPRAEIITGPAGILLANAMHGEITPAMAAAVSASDALKVLIPFGKCSLQMAGVEPLSIEEYVRRAVSAILERIGK
ncbi:MAG: DUF3842 family protein [Christensenellales bacterium]|jgi:hypothetical protein